MCLSVYRREKHIRSLEKQIFLALGSEGNFWSITSHWKRVPKYSMFFSLLFPWYKLRTHSSSGTQWKNFWEARQIPAYEVFYVLIWPDLQKNRKSILQAAFCIISLKQCFDRNWAANCLQLLRSILVIHKYYEEDSTLLKIPPSVTHLLSPLLQGLSDLPFSKSSWKTCFPALDYVPLFFLSFCLFWFCTIRFQIMNRAVSSLEDKEGTEGR